MFLVRGQGRCVRKVLNPVFPGQQIRLLRDLGEASLLLPLDVPCGQRVMDMGTSVMVRHRCQECLEKRVSVWSWPQTWAMASSSIPRHTPTRSTSLWSPKTHAGWTLTAPLALGVPSWGLLKHGENHHHHTRYKLTYSIKAWKSTNPFKKKHKNSQNSSMGLEVRNISPGCGWKGIQGGAGVMAMSFLDLGAGPVGVFTVSSQWVVHVSGLSMHFARAESLPLCPILCAPMDCG